MQAWLCIGVFLWAGGSPFPYEKAGLTREEAAAHLVNRMTFGATPGLVDRVSKMGLEIWFERQLAADFPDKELNEKLKRFPALAMTNRQLLETWPPGARILKMAENEGVVSKDAIKSDDPAEMRQALMCFAAEKGARPMRELENQVIGQKLVRAVYSENQVQEALTDFWFNHFTVSTVNKRARPFILTYERDAIRPNALGQFRQLLGKTARHPAMLLYLDNAGSTADKGVKTTLDANLAESRIGMARRQRRPAKLRKNQGINENYARELLELHTLGVDGGYSQDDVVHVTRAFSGWTVWPMTNKADHLQLRVLKGRFRVFVRDGDFLFRADSHDAGAKTILGQGFKAGGGIEEGERVLDLLAAHPATARFISLKLARRFVADQPPESLVNSMAQAFSSSDGDIKTLLRVMVASPEFWSQAARQEKVKTPLELAVSAVRALDAQVNSTRGLASWIDKMGQPLYAAPAPNGYSDEGASWLNPGSLAIRLEFIQKLTDHRIPGVYPDKRISRETDAEDLDKWVKAIFPPEGWKQTTGVLLKSENPSVGMAMATPGFQMK